MTKWLLNIFTLIILLIYAHVNAQDDLHLTGRGPLKIRNQFTIGLQFLSFPADDAFTSSKNDMELGIKYSHSNTFAQSPGVLNNLSILNGRVELTPGLAGKLASTDGNPNRFLIDSGLGRANININYGLSDRFTLELDIPIMAFHGGFLDTPIEMIHQFAGFPNASRSMLSTNTSQLFFSGQQGNLFFSSDDFGGPGLGDILLMVKAQIYKSHIHGFAFAVRTALKLPTGNYKYLRGSGSLDYGIDLIATKKVGNGFISTNLSGVFPGKWKLMPQIQLKQFYSWNLAYEYLWGNRLSFILQNQVQSSPFYINVDPEISKISFEWTAGVKYDAGKNYRISFSITENYIHHNNTADFGFTIGISRRF